MLLQDLTGQRVPLITFNVREGHAWVEKNTNDYFARKRVVLFALPGAYTPTCSSTHLPRYNELYDIFRAQGIDDIICLAVNDTFVMSAWQKEQKADNLTMLPDGNGELTEAMGMLVDKNNLGFGKRSWRYSMLVNDGSIEKMFIESQQPGDPFETSDAVTMLRYINPNIKVPPSVTLLTRPGCPFCAKAKELLTTHKLNFEELVLNRDFSIKTLLALSGKTTVPQIFIDGEKIGGSDDLAAYLEK